MIRPTTCLLFTFVLVFLTGPALATLVFNNGGDNTFNAFSAVPLVVEDAANGNPTHLNVLAGPMSTTPAA